MKLAVAMIIFSLVLIAFRAFGALDGWFLQNFSPFVALIFCGALYRKVIPWLLPVVFGAWVLSSPLVSWLQGYEVMTAGFFLSLASFGLILAGAWRIQRPSWLNTLGGTLVAASVFYLVTNTGCFLLDPLYSKTWLGLKQALWSGPEGSMVPTWAFFRNSLVSSLLFSSTLAFSLGLSFDRKEQIGLASLTKVS